MSQPYCDSDGATSSFLSSNATADNNVGAGRMMGQCYAYFGIILEIWLNKLAEKRGRGPYQSASRISANRARTLHKDSIMAAAAALKNGQDIVEDCQGLLGYVNSTTPKTFKQACDQITDLSVKDPFVRDLFIKLDAKKVIEHSSASREEYLDDAGYTSSRKALISLADTEIYKIIEILSAIPERGHDWKNESQLVGLGEKLMSFMRSDEKAFLFFRLLIELPPHVKQFLIGLFKDKDVSAAFANFTENTEWTHTDQLLASYLSIMSKEAFLIAKRGFVLEKLLRIADKFPLTFNSAFYQGLVDLRWYADGRNTHLFSIMFVLFKGIRNSDVIHDEFHLDFSYLLSNYPRFLFPLLVKLSCDPDMILCHILAEGYEGRDNLFVNSSDGYVIPPLKRLDYLCQALVGYVDSEELNHQRRARDHVETLLKKDICCRTIIERALAETVFSQSQDCDTLIASTAFACAPRPVDSQYESITIYRRCNAEGRVIQISGSLSGLSYDNESILEVWNARAEDMIWLHIPPGEVFYITDGEYACHPISAGLNVRGEQEYVACLPVFSPQTRKIFNDFLTVARGRGTYKDRAPRFRHDAKIEDGFYILALRYDPGAYSDLVRLSDGRDTTGPFSWESIENILSAGPVED